MQQTNQTQMGNGLIVEVVKMTPWELERLNFQTRNGVNAKYDVVNIDEYEATN